MADTLWIHATTLFKNFINILPRWRLLSLRKCTSTVPYTMIVSSKLNIFPSLHLMVCYELSPFVEDQSERLFQPSQIHGYINVGLWVLHNAWAILLYRGTNWCIRWKASVLFKLCLENIILRNCFSISPLIIDSKKPYSHPSQFTTSRSMFLCPILLFFIKYGKAS